MAILPKDHVHVAHLAKQKYERMPLALNVIRKKSSVFYRKVLSFGPNRTVEVWPNSWPNRTFGRSLLPGDEYFNNFDADQDEKLVNSYEIK